MHGLHRLFEDSSSTGGGGTATEPQTDGAADGGGDGGTPPAKPVTRIAGAFPGGGSQAAPTDDAAAAKPAGFDWKGKLPDGAPDVFKKYKTWEDVSKAHSSLQTEYGNLKKSKIEPLTQEQWAGWVSDYYDTGEISDEALQTIQRVTGIPPQLAADFFATMKAKRTEFVDKANADLKGMSQTVTYDDIEQWLSDPSNHDFSPNAIAGFQELSARGDTSWLKPVLAAFTDSGGIGTGDAASVPANPPPAARKAPTRQGRPAGAGSHDGYKTRAEYQADAAAASGDPMKLKAARDKLMRTPESVRNSWGPA